ncbi:MAG: cobalt transporter CbiM [Nitrospinae bacterium]|nr:cobalt transporter CbiM [Nitrospinota bacterium]
MHIPDGYLGPQTYGTLYGVMLPIWYWASRKVKETLKSKQAPLLALASAFSFVIMMFNVPAPGGSTGHAVGGALIAIVLGPWQALMAITVALVIQSLLFGDGGVTAIGANCFNMAFVMPFTAYLFYWMIRGNADASSKRSLIAGFIAGYVSLNIAAILTAVEFGIQPFIARGADGAPLYCPYPLSVTVPVMAFEHLLVFGWIEGAVTSLVLSYISRTEPDLIAVGIKLKRLWVGLAFLIILTPLGLIAQGTAWGEWSAEELKKILGFIPEGIGRLEGIWIAMFGGYNMQGWEGQLMSAAGYILSAFIGVAVIAGAAFIFGRLLSACPVRKSSHQEQVSSLSLRAKLSNVVKEGE